MKAFAQTVKSGPVPAPRSSVEVKGLKRRSGAANRLRQKTNAHEREANDVARKVVKGNGLPRSLSSAPVAGYECRGSRGLPLATDLRLELEDRFNADFSRVRIHTDSAASLAARAEAALAFATGTHIYFAEGQFRPNSEAGSLLLSHELTHVLQQTGRVSSGNRIVATPVTGAGPIQCNPDDYADKKVLFLETGQTAWKALTERHSVASPTDETLKALIERINLIVAGWIPLHDSTLVPFLVNIATTHSFQPATKTSPLTLTIPATSFLLDCLKVSKTDTAFEAAATLLEEDKAGDLRSTFGPRTDFREFLEKSNRGDMWLSQVFEQEPLKAYWSIYLNTFKQFLLNPFRPIQSLYGFDEAKKKALANLDGKESTLLPFNDRVLMAFELMERADGFRVALMSRVDQKSEEKYKNSTAEQRRLERPDLLVAACDELIEKPLDKTKIFLDPEIQIDIAKKVRSLAVQAQGFWLKVRQFQTQIIDRMIQSDRDTRFEGVVKMDHPFAEDHPLMAPLRKALSTVGDPSGLFFLDDQRKTTSIPSPIEYQKRIKALMQAIDFQGRLKDNFLLALQQALVKSQNKGELDSQEARAIGWMLLWNVEFLAVLSSYSPKNDSATFADGRLAHRRLVGAELLLLAQAAQWFELRDLFAHIMHGRDRDKSYLVVPGQWEVHEEYPVSKLQQDFADVELVGYHGLRPSHLSHFFQGEFLESMAKAINKTIDLLRKDPKREFKKKDSDELEARVQALSRPWRCEPDKSAFVILRDEDLDKSTSKLTQSQLINGTDSKDTKSRSELERLLKVRGLGASGDWITKVAPPVELPIYAWIVPDFTPLITALKNTEPFKSRMIGKGLQNLNEGEWLEELIKISGPTISDDLLTAIDKRVKDQKAFFDDTMQQHVAFQRRLLTREWAPKLKKYKNNFKYNRELQVPKKVAEALWHFRGYSEPMIDVDRQQALLILGLADEFEDAFDNPRKAINIPAWFLDALTKTLNFIKPAQDSKDPKASPEQKKFIDEVLFKNNFDLTQSENIDDFLNNEQKVKDLITHMEDARTAIQEEMGFESVDGETLQSVDYSQKLRPGPDNAMEIQGDEWELVEVSRKFTYHPPLGFSAMSSKTSHAVLKNEDGKEIPFDGKPLATFLINGDEMELFAYDDDDHLLERGNLKALSDAMLNYSISKDMGELADALESGAMFMIDVMELIPAIGQEMMIARLTINMITFGNQIPRIADALKKDPIGYLTNAAEKLANKYLKPENIILFFLLGKGLEPLGNPDERKPAPDTTSNLKIKGKLAKVISALRKIALRLADALRWIRLRVAGPVRSLQSSLVTRPKLGWLLHRAIDALFMLGRLFPSNGATKEERMYAVLMELVPIGTSMPETGTDEDKQTSASGMLSSVSGEMKDHGSFFKDQLDSVLDHLVEVSVPKQIFPLDKIIGAVIDYFLGRLGAKVKMAKRVLEHTDIYQQFLDKISSALKDLVTGSKVDPNYYWQTLVLDKVDEFLIDARKQLIEEVYKRTDEIASITGLDFLRLPQPAKEKAEFHLGREEKPMVELDAIHGEVPARGKLAQLPESPGQPLAASVRLAEERRFGHDFRHVRLHRGREAGVNLEDLRANALTSGSHVFLRPGLDPMIGKGAKVLRHELTHVLQQTGPRPKGTVRETRPVRGKSKKGITVDQMREAAADAMSKVDRAAVARTPVEVDSGAEGIQPSFEDAVSTVLDTLTTFQGAEDFEKPTVGRKVPGEAQARMAWALVHAGLSNCKTQAYIVPAAKILIEAHITSLVKEDDVVLVANMAQKPKKGARGKRPKNTDLDFERFVTLLEGFIFAKTGIGMQLKLSNPPSIKLTSAEMTYVNFGVISPTSKTGIPLWDKVMKATPGFGSEDQKKLRNELYGRFSGLGPDPFIWKAGRAEFRFSEEFVEAFGKVRVASRKPKLDSELPKKSDYVAKGGKEGVGLKTGVHKDQRGTDRESHHTTQYLLVQYFRNNNTVKAWKGGRDYPGITPTTGTDRRAFTVGGKDRLGLKSLDPNDSSRGDQMPAILVSADLHKRGRLHIDREPRWTGREEDPDGDEAQGSARQGFAIDHAFKSALKGNFGTTDEDAAAWDKAVKGKGKQAENLIEDAMLQTYSWMRSIMIPALERGLLTRELAYYRGVASRQYLDGNEPPKLKTEYNLTADDLRSVFNDAKANNDTVMKAAGWVAR